MTAFRNFFKGKKTYMAAACLVLVAGLGFWFGEVNATTAGAMVSMALGFCGLAAKADRYARAMIAALILAQQVERDRESGKFNVEAYLQELAAIGIEFGVPGLGK